MINVSELLKNAKSASRKIARLTTLEKNTILNTLANIIERDADDILDANERDVREAERNGLGSMIDRLQLTHSRIEDIANDVRNVALLHDFVGEVLPTPETPSGIQTEKIRVPLGVVAMIYESRPNVTIDAASLAFKSGNAIILKGGKEAMHSNKVLADIFRGVLNEYGLQDAVQLMENATREHTALLMKAKGYIDLLIPRGGKGLIEFVTKNAQVPVIETGASVVHTFVDESANTQMALDIIINEKTRRTSVCNALDTVLVHQSIADTFLPQLVVKLEEAGVQIHTANTGVDFSTEWLSNDISIAVVENIDAALDHIYTYSLGHSECIITDDQDNADRFLREVDAACVYHNASTCFSDGAQFGLGAEIGISTQKLHARGPFALQGLTTEKWIVKGKGETRS